MPITISTSQSIGAVAGVTQSDESHATIADSIQFSGTAALTLDKSLFCQRLLLSSTGNQLIAGTNNGDGSFATAKEIYINPASPENGYFSSAPPLDLTGFFTLSNCDLVAGSNIATSDQTTFIGQFPTPSAALTGGANRTFKNVRIRSVNRSGIVVYIAHATIDGLTFDRIDFIFIEASPVSAKNMSVSNSNWGIGHSDRSLISLSSSIFTRVFIQNNVTTGNQLSLTDIVVSERYMFRAANNQDLTAQYNLLSSFGITNGTTAAKFTLFDKNNNALTTQTADSNGNTTAANIQYAVFTAGSVGAAPTNSSSFDSNNAVNFIASSNIATWQTTLPSKFTSLLLPLRVVHYGYNFLPSGQFINSIDTTQLANASGFRFSPKLATDTSVTLSESAALALTTISTLNDLYDAIKAFRVTTANAWYPAPGVQIATGSKAAQLIDFGSRSLTIDPSATISINVNTSTNLVTAKSTNLVKTTAFNTIKTSGTLTLKSNFDFFGDIGSTGVVVVQPDTINLITWTFEIGATINVDSPTGTAIVTVAADQLSKITAGVRVIIQSPVASITAPNFAQNTRVQVARLEPYSVPSTAINTATGIITIAGNRFKSASPATLVYFQLAAGATIPTTTPQIANNTLYFVRAAGLADGLTAGQFKLSLIEGGTAIAFTTQGSGNFTLTGITELDTSLAGAGGYSAAFTEPNNTLLQVSAQPWQNIIGCTAGNFYRQNIIWNSTSGNTIADIVSVSATPDVIHNSLIGRQIEASGTTVTLPADGSLVTGISFSAQGVISLDARVFPLINGRRTLTSQAAYLFTVYYRSTIAGIRLISNQLLAQDRMNFVLAGLTLDNIADGIRNTPNTAATIAGGYIATIDGANPIKDGSGAIYLNADTRGVAITTTSGATIAPTQQQIRDAQALALSAGATIAVTSIDSKLDNAGSDFVIL